VIRFRDAERLASGHFGLERGEASRVPGRVQVAG